MLAALIYWMNRVGGRPLPPKSDSVLFAPLIANERMTVRCDVQSRHCCYLLRLCMFSFLLNVKLNLGQHCSTCCVRHTWVG